MKDSLRLAAAAAILIAAAACSTLWDASDYLAGVVDAATTGSVEGIAQALDAYCTVAGPATGTRKRLVDSVNNAASKGAITPFDCDRDGEPDFPHALPTTVETQPL